MVTSYLCVVYAEAGPEKTETQSHQTGLSYRPDWTGWSSVVMEQMNVINQHQTQVA